MYRRANSKGLLIAIDPTHRVLHIATDAPLLPGTRGVRRELATFDSWEAWENSEYSKQVTDVDVYQDIAWFWNDLAHETPATS